MKLKFPMLSQLSLAVSKAALSALTADGGAAEMAKKYFELELGTVERLIQQKRMCASIAASVEDKNTLEIIAEKNLQTVKHYEGIITSLPRL